MTTSNDEGLTALVERLTETQQRALLEAKGGHVALKYGYPHVVGVLAAEGLLPPRVKGQQQDARLTKLGLAAAAALKARAKMEQSI